MTDILGIQDVLASAIAGLRGRLAYLPREYEDVQNLAKKLADALDIVTNAEMYLEAARREQLLAIWEDLVKENLSGPDDGFDRYPLPMHGKGELADLCEAVKIKSGSVLRENDEPRRERIDTTFSNLMQTFEYGISEGAPELVGALERERERNGPQAFYEILADMWQEYEKDNLPDLYAGQKVLAITEVYSRPDDFREVAVKYIDAASVDRLLSHAGDALTSTGYMDSIVPTYVIGHIIDARSIVEALDNRAEEILVSPDTMVFAMHDPLAGVADIVLAEREKGHVQVGRIAVLDHGDTGIGGILDTDLWKWS